jgi:hypothetical protein
MDENIARWVHYRWKAFAYDVTVFGAYESEADARAVCPIDVFEQNGWVVEGVAPVRNDARLAAGLRWYEDLTYALDEAGLLDA